MGAIHTVPSVRQFPAFKRVVYTLFIISLSGFKIQNKTSERAFDANFLLVQIMYRYSYASFVLYDTFLEGCELREFDDGSFPTKVTL